MIKINLLKIFLSVILTLFLFNLCYAEQKNNENKLFELISLTSLSCIERGQEYYTDVNTHMTSKTLAYDKNVDNIVKDCMETSTKSFYDDNDINFNNYLINTFKNKNFLSKFYNIAYCSFSEGYFFLQNNKGKRMSFDDKSISAKICINSQLKDKKIK